MRFYFHPEAEAELDKAVEYYEQRQQGLGLEFVEEVYATITRIKTSRNLSPGDQNDFKDRGSNEEYLPNGRLKPNLP